MELKNIYEKTGKLLKEMSGAIKEKTPKYAKFVGSKAKRYGEVGIQKVDIQILNNKLHKQYQSLGEEFFKQLQETPKKDLSKKMQNYLKEIISLKSSIDSKEKSLKRNLQKAGVNIKRNPNAPTPSSTPRPTKSTKSARTSRTSKKSSQ